LITQIVTFIDPLFKEDQSTVDMDPHEFREEQELVSRLVHLVIHVNPDVYWQQLEVFKERFYQGNAKRQLHNLPPLFFSYIKLARYVNKCKNSVDYEATENEETETEAPEAQPNKKIYNLKKKIFKGEYKLSFEQILKQLKEIVEKLASDHHELALKLYLEIILIINECDHTKEVIQSY